MKKIKGSLVESYTSLLAITYVLYFFGGGFIPAIIYLRDKEQAVACAAFGMIISLYLYIRINDNTESFGAKLKKWDFQFLVWLMWLMPFIVKEGARWGNL